MTKKVFPQIRRLCESRGLFWTAVDLRWGITEEQSRRGDVLPLCLAQIDRCTPFFIGILGGRYGWVPPAVSAELVDAYPWVASHPGASVTELEIWHGALNRGPSAAHALFYFLETATGVTDEGEEAARRLAKLRDRIRGSGFPLREGVRSPEQLGTMLTEDLMQLIDGLYPAAEKPSAEELERGYQEAFAREKTAIYLVPDGLRAVLKGWVAGGTSKSCVVGQPGIGKSAAMAYAAELARTEYPGAFVLMYAAGGASLISPDLSSWRHNQHSVSLRADPRPVVNYLWSQLNQYLESEEECPRDAGQWQERFAERLNMAAIRGRVFLILDGLDHLLTAQGGPRLGWLPEPADGVNFLIAARPGPTADHLRAAGWAIHQLQPLSGDEVAELATRYLAAHGKALAAPQLERLSAAHACGNPLFLRALLDELRVFGKHEELPARLTHFLGAADATELYERALTEWEIDYREGGRDLVREGLELVVTARHGLFERELLVRLGVPADLTPARRKMVEDMPMDASFTNGLDDPALWEALPMALWAAVALRAEHGLDLRAGRVVPANDEFREAVCRRYLADNASRRAAHARLAEFFRYSKFGPRRTEELPWHLLQSEQWERLRDCISGTGMFSHLMDLDPAALRFYWGALEGQYDPVESYAAALAEWEHRLATVSPLRIQGLDENDPEAFYEVFADPKFAELQQMQDEYARRERITLLSLLVEFFAHVLGRPEAAVPYAEQLRRFRASNSRTIEEVVYGWLEQSETEISNGNIEGALRTLTHALEQATSVLGEGHPTTARLYTQLGVALTYAMRHADAADAHRHALEIRQRSDTAMVFQSLFYLAQALDLGGDGARAVERYREALAVADRSCGPRSQDVGMAQCGLASALSNASQFDEADAMYREGIAVLEEVLGLRHSQLCASLTGYALCCRRRGDLARAESLYRRALACPQVSPLSQANTEFNLAVLLAISNRVDEAVDMMFHVLRSREEHLAPCHHAVLQTMHELGVTLASAGRLVQAAEVLAAGIERAHGREPQKELELLLALAGVCRASGDAPALVRTLLQESALWDAANHPDRALERAREAAGVTGVPADVAVEAVCCQARLHVQNGDRTAALVALRDAEARLADTADDQVREAGLFGLASAFLGLDAVAAGRLQAEHRAACERLDDLALLLSRLIELAQHAHELKDWPTTHSLYTEAAHICRARNLAIPLAIVVGQQGLTYQSEGRPSEALAAHRHAEQLADQGGNVTLIITSLLNQVAILDDMYGDPIAATPLAMRAESLARQYAPDDLPRIERSLKILERRIASRQERD